MSSSPHRQPRRTVLRASAAAVAGFAAAPYVITSKALGDATTPPASDRIVIGGIGIGGQGSSDQNAFLGRPDVQYVAVCDARQRLREQAKGRVDGKYGNQDCSAYVDFRELLARDDIDAVHIATPDHWHAIMTITACRAGKDVYLQKPETLTLREGPLMIAVARRYGRVVSGGSQRVREDYRRLVDPLWAGEIGDAKTIDIFLREPLTSGPCLLPAQQAPPDIDWNLWLGSAPWEPYHPDRCGGWRSHVDYSGGILTDWGAHHFGGATFAADIREMQPEAAAWHPAEGAFPAWVSVIYPNGTEIHCNRPAELQTVPPTLEHAHHIKIVASGTPREAKPVPGYRGQGGIYGDFIECVKTRERPFRDIEIAVNTMVALHMIGIACRLERSLVWDRAAQRFTGDDEANRFLDRARRQPWQL